MLVQLLIASAAIVLTLLVQVAFIGTAISTLAGISAAVWIWALLYIWLGVVDSLDTAVYFSTVAFTTLGFGDITLSEDWRLTSALMAANGLLLFSLNTAFLIEVIRRLIPPRR